MNVLTYPEDGAEFYLQYVSGAFPRDDSWRFSGIQRESTTAILSTESVRLFSCALLGKGSLDHSHDLGRHYDTGVFYDNDIIRGSGSLFASEAAAPAGLYHQRLRV